VKSITLGILSSEEKNIRRNKGKTPTPHGSILSSLLNKLVDVEAMAPEEATATTQTLWSLSPSSDMKDGHGYCHQRCHRGAFMAPAVGIEEQKQPSSGCSVTEELQPFFLAISPWRE
jgi:hypothetical protein